MKGMPCSFKTTRGEREMYVEQLIVVVHEDGGGFKYLLKCLGYDNKCPHAYYMDKPLAVYSSPQEAYKAGYEICSKYPMLDEVPFEDYPLFEM